MTRCGAAFRSPPASLLGAARAGAAAASAHRASTALPGRGGGGATTEARCARTPLPARQRRRRVRRAWPGGRGRAGAGRVLRAAACGAERSCRSHPARPWAYGPGRGSHSAPVGMAPLTPSDEHGLPGRDGGEIAGGCHKSGLPGPSRRR